MTRRPTVLLTAAALLGALLAPHARAAHGPHVELATIQLQAAHGEAWARSVGYFHAGPRGAGVIVVSTVYVFRHNGSFIGALGTVAPRILRHQTIPALSNWVGFRPGECVHAVSWAQELGGQVLGAVRLGTLYCR